QLPDGSRGGTARWRRGGRSSRYPLWQLLYCNRNIYALPKHSESQVPVAHAGSFYVGSRRKPSHRSAPNTAMKISVVIPMLNEAEHISRTLRAISEAAKFANLDHEVIVVDNGSSDSGPQIAARHGARVVVAGDRTVG